MKYLTHTLLSFSLALGVAFPSLAQTTYDLKVQLREADAALEGEVHFSYKHTGSETLNSLLFRLDANAHSKMKIQEVTTEEGLVLPSGHYAYPYLGRTLEDPLIYEVKLATPLKNGDSIQLKFKYALDHLPRLDQSFFLIDDPHQQGLGAWYPRLLGRKDGHWEPTLLTQANYKVAAKSSNRKFYALSPLGSVNLSKADWAYHYEDKEGTGLDLVFTSNLLLRSATLEDVSIRLYYPASLQKWGVQSLEIVQDILKFYKERYGVYPKKSLTVVLTQGAKRPMLASDQLLIASYDLPAKDQENHVRGLLAYGVAQQYWGMRVRESGKYLPWLTQGLSLYLAQIYLKNKSQLFPWGTRLTDRYLATAGQGWNTALNTPWIHFRKQPFDSFNALAQGKGYTIMRLLDILLGTKVVGQAEIGLQKSLLNKELTEQAFIDAVQTASGKELGWFFKQWTQSNQVLDYAIESLQVSQIKNKYKATVNLHRVGEIIMPVSLTFKLKNGEQIFKLWNGEKKNETLIFEVPAQVEEVILDRAHVTPDIQRSNNAYKLESK